MNAEHAADDARRTLTVLRSLLPLVYRRWAKYYGTVARDHHWGTMRAVQAFADEVDTQLFVTWMRPGKSNRSSIYSEGSECYAWPAWYMIKSGTSEGE